MSQDTRTLSKVLHMFIIVKIVVVLCMLSKHSDITWDTPNTCFHLIFQLFINEAKFKGIDILTYIAVEVNSLGLLACIDLSSQAGTL